MAFGELVPVAEGDSGPPAEEETETGDEGDDREADWDALWKE